MKLTIPKHILQQLKIKDGRNHKSAIKFNTEDAKHSTELEYILVRHLLNELGIKHYRILSQTLMIDRFYRIYDLIEVRAHHGKVMKFFFNISETFGRYDPHNRLTRSVYLGY